MPKILFDQLGIDDAMTVRNEADVVGSGEREVEVRLRVGVAIVDRHLRAVVVETSSTVPKGNSLWAAVKPDGSYSSPEAVGLPATSSP